MLWYRITRIISTTNVKRYIWIVLIKHTKLAFLTRWWIIGILSIFSIYYFVEYGTIFPPVLTPKSGRMAFNSCHYTLTAHFFIVPSTSTTSTTSITSVNFNLPALLHTFLSNDMSSLPFLCFIILPRSRWFQFRLIIRNFTQMNRVCLIANLHCENHFLWRRSAST